ncbi:hypothetical protein [Chitinophaga sp. Cy-1792]|nr:hypothetical protein [Chitinophaga sp. Cy-1792]
MKEWTTARNFWENEVMAVLEIFLKIVQHNTACFENAGLGRCKRK